jgi:hypothetical protein
MKHSSVWRLSWRTLSNGLLVAAFITAYGGNDTGAIFLLALAILTRLWHQEELREKEKCSVEASKPLI